MACSVSCLFLPCNIVHDENGRHWFEPGHTLSTLVITTDAEVAMTIKLITTRWLNMVCITRVLVFKWPWDLFPLSDVATWEFLVSKGFPLPRALVVTTTAPARAFLWNLGRGRNCKRKELDCPPTNTVSWWSPRQAGFPQVPRNWWPFHVKTSWALLSSWNRFPLYLAQRTSLARRSWKKSLSSENQRSPGLGSLVEQLEQVFQYIVPSNSSSCIEKVHRETKTTAL